MLLLDLYIAKQFPQHADLLMQLLLSHKKHFAKITSSEICYRSFTKLANAFPDHKNAIIQMVLADDNEFKRLTQQRNGYSKTIDIDQLIVIASIFPSHAGVIIKKALTECHEYLMSAADLKKLQTLSENNSDAKEFMSAYCVSYIHQVLSEQRKFEKFISRFNELFEAVEMSPANAGTLYKKTLTGPEFYRLISISSPFEKNLELARAETLMLRISKDPLLFDACISGQNANFVFQALKSHFPEISIFKNSNSFQEASEAVKKKTAAKLEKTEKKQSIVDVISEIEKLPIFTNKELILDKLRSMKSPDENFNADIEFLRREFDNIVNDANITNIELENLSLTDTAYRALLALADHYPTNDIDPMTLEEFDEEDRVNISTGQQFNIITLIDYHNARAYRGTGYPGEKYQNDFFRETDKQKFLCNPLTNLPFSILDEQHIIEVAQQKNITIPDLKIQMQEAVRTALPLTISDADAVDFMTQGLNPQQSAHVRAGMFAARQFARVEEEALRFEGSEEVYPRFGGIEEAAEERFILNDLVTLHLLTEEQREELTAQERNNLGRHAIYPLLTSNLLTVDEARSLTAQEGRNLATQAVSTLCSRRLLTIPEARGLSEAQRSRLEAGENIAQVMGGREDASPPL